MSKIQRTDGLGEEASSDGAKKLTIVIQGKGKFLQFAALADGDVDGNFIITISGHGVGNGITADGGHVANGAVQVTYDGPQHPGQNVFEGNGEVHIVP